MTALIAALTPYWLGADRSALKAAIVPPCDALGDEVYDVALAVVFRDVAGGASVIARMGRIQQAIDANLPQIEFCRLRGNEPNARRVEAMVKVLENWNREILSAVERCPDCGAFVGLLSEHGKGGCPEEEAA